MKRLIFTLTSLFLFNGLFAQSLIFSENFENYNAGDFPTGWTNQWTDQGTIKVQDTLVAQGAKALKVTGLPNNCKGIYKTGTVNSNDVDIFFDILIPNGNTVGQTPAYFIYGGITLRTKMLNTDTFYLDNNETPLILTNFTVDNWYSMQLQVDMDNSKYRLINLTTHDTSAIYSFTPNIAGGWASDISLYGNNHTSGNNTGFFDEIYQYTANYDSTFTGIGLCLNNEPLDTNNWIFYSYNDTSYLPPDSGRFEQTNQGLTFYGTGYRKGSYIHYTPFDKYPINENTVIYYKWLAHGPSGYYMAVGCALMTDTTSTALKTTHYTTDHSYLGSVVVNDDTWYFTKIEFDNDSVYLTTSTGNYIDQGGTLFNQQNTFLDTSYYGIRFFIHDNYGDTNAYVKLADFKIQENCNNINYFITESHNLDDNQVPVGWVGEEINPDAEIANGQINAHITDAGYFLHRYGIMPQNTDSVIIKWTSATPYTYWGSSGNVRIPMHDNKMFYFLYENYKDWSSQAKAYIRLYDYNTSTDLVLVEQLDSLTTDTFNYTLIITDTCFRFIGNKQF